VPLTQEEIEKMSPDDRLDLEPHVALLVACFYTRLDPRRWQSRPVDSD